MSFSSSDNDIAALREDLAALKRDVAGLVDHLKTSASNHAGRATAQVDDSIKKLAEEAASLAGASAENINRHIEERPLATLLVVLGLGYLAGRMLPR